MGRTNITNMTGGTRVEVTRGVFDPRTYREQDKVNWARKRRSDWMASTGQIHFVRSRTVASEEREIQKQEEAAKEEEPAEVVVKKAPNATQWVGRKRSDVTRNFYY